jgi:hypothetical protein
LVSNLSNAMRRDGQRLPLLYGLAALTAVFIGVALFSGWLFFAISALDQRSYPWIVSLSFPVVVCLILSIAQRFDAAFEPRADDPFTRSAPTASWVLSDPTLLTFGHQRCETEFCSPGIDDCTNGKFIDGLVTTEPLDALPKPENDPLWDRWLDG